MHSFSFLTLSATSSQHRSAVRTVYLPTPPTSLTLSAFLIISEVSIFRTYFARQWPLLSPAHGFVTLGLAMLVLGANMLGNLNKQATSQETMGLAFWRIVIGSGILVLILGFLNICAVSNISFITLATRANPSILGSELHLPRQTPRRHCPPSPLQRRHSTNHRTPEGANKSVVLRQQQ